MPLPVSSVCRLKDISQRTLESFSSILSGSRVFLICLAQVTLESLEVGVKLVQLCLNFVVNLIQF